MAKFCTNCGNQLEDHFNACPNCGTPSPSVVTNQAMPNNQYNGYYQSPPIQENGVEYVWVVLGFLFPIVGWVLWATWAKTKPKTAKAAGIAGCIGFAGGIIVNLLLLV